MKERQPIPNQPDGENAVWAADFMGAYRDSKVPRIPGWELSRPELNQIGQTDNQTVIDMKLGEPVVLTGIPAKLRPGSQM